MLERLNADMVAAMKSGDKELVNVIRMVKAAIQMGKENQRDVPNDEAVIDVIAKQIKMRNEANAEFEKGNRGDLIEKNNKEIEILKKYLPAQLSDEELETMISDIIKKVDAKVPSDMGKIMKELVPMVRGKADMAKVNMIIKNKLNSL